MAKRKAAGPIKESSQSTKLKGKENETSVSHSAGVDAYSQHVVAGHPVESSQKGKEKETSASLSAGAIRENYVLANYNVRWQLYGPVPDRECLFAPVLELLEYVKYEGPEILTKPFLVACRHTTPITAQFGGSLASVRLVIFNLVVRMESVYASNPSKFKYLYSLLKFEVETNNFREQGCSTVSLVWLTRYMEFMVELFRNFMEHPDWITFQACYYAFDKTLKKWIDRNFITPQYAPKKEELLKIIGGNGDVMGDIEKFCTSFTPLLKQNHEFLAPSGASFGRKVPNTYEKKGKMGKTMFGPALEELKSVKSESGEILTKHFLESCKKILPVIDKFGQAVSIVKRAVILFAAVLESRYSSNPSKFNYLYSLVQIEIERDAVNRLCSNTYNLYQLKRNMDFVVELFRNLVEHPDWITFQACNESYGKTLKPWHERQEWIHPSDRKWQMDREKFMEVIGGNGDVMGYKEILHYLYTST